MFFILFLLFIRKPSGYSWSLYVCFVFFFAFFTLQKNTSLIFHRCLITHLLNIVGLFLDGFLVNRIVYDLVKKNSPFVTVWLYSRNLDPCLHICRLNDWQLQFNKKTLLFVYCWTKAFFCDWGIFGCRKCKIKCVIWWNHYNNDQHKRKLWQW